MNVKILRTLLSVLLALAILALCAGCGGDPSAAPEGNDPGQTTAPSGQGSSGAEVSNERQEQFSQDEYVLYQNVFYQDYGKSCDGTKVTKTGVFASVYDAYNSRTRYYVWGYYDQTRCCDWQWEFVPQDEGSLPPAGSLVKVSGTFSYDDSALDKYWITDAQVTLKTEYAGPSAERDMRSMSCTLERVQMINILYHADVFEGQEFFAYGRIAAPDTLQDPYYDGSWQIGFAWDGSVPAVGTLVEISGTIENGKLIVQSMKNI